MGLLDFLNSKLRIRTAADGSIKKYTIFYPQKKGGTIAIGMDILRNILQDHAIIVHIDTSLFFLKPSETDHYTYKIKNMLSALGINFEYRIFKADHAHKGVLGSLNLFDKKQIDHQIITFALQQQCRHQDLLESLLEVGCQIYVPYENQYNTELVYRVFNAHFHEEHDRFSIFKCVLFINDWIGQTVLQTKSLTLNDVEKICGK